MPELSKVFDTHGLLARHLPGYTRRVAQEDMALMVDEALSYSRHLAVEAGTGIGKTFGYLVPALMSGRRTAISTGTLTLQDQLFKRDLPLLGAVVGRPVRVALLKGRRNYLCRHRLETARQGAVRDPALLDRLAAVHHWARTEDSGDLTLIDDFTNDYSLRTWITSTADNCLGGRCPQLDDCFLVEARRRAMAADVVVVNHHLLLADLTLKEAGFGQLLPDLEAVIVDEAHQLPDIAQQFFGVSVGSRELQNLARDVVAETRAAGISGELEPLADDLARAAADARLEFGEHRGRLHWNACPSGVNQSLRDWEGALERMATALEEARGMNPGLERCWERSRDGIARLKALDDDESRGLRWVEVSRHSFAAHWTPLDVGAELGERIRAQDGTWVFTSATLAVGDDFSHFLGRIGVPDAGSAVLPSPFNYRENARLYLPQGLPQPAAPDYIERVLACVWPLIEAAGGGAFLLFTSYRALNAAAAWIDGRALPGPLLVQGEGPRTELLTRFRSTTDAVLLGTSSFWQGVDVRGPALRLVVIDKLPFAAPGDPLIQARLHAIRRDGGDPFSEFQLPQAVLALKQGVGRLIRDFSDRGLVVICDPRLRTRHYGRVFLESLPPMPILDEPDQALGFVDSLPKGAGSDGSADTPTDSRADTRNETRAHAPKDSRADTGTETCADPGIERREIAGI